MRKLQKVSKSYNFQLSKPAFLRSCNQSKRVRPQLVAASVASAQGSAMVAKSTVDSLDLSADEFPMGWKWPRSWGNPSFFGEKTLRNVEQFEAGNPIIFGTGFPMVSHLCHYKTQDIPRYPGYKMAGLELQHHTASTSCANGNP